MALEPGAKLGSYHVTALIGEVGMGQVYQATDTKLNRQVALKEPAAPVRERSGAVVRTPQRSPACPPTRSDAPGCTLPLPDCNRSPEPGRITAR